MSKLLMLSNILVVYLCAITEHGRQLQTNMTTSPRK